MKPGYTHITVLLDRSGSMASIADDVIGGFNSFISGQKEVGGEATVTLVQFDSAQPYEVLCNMAPIGEVRPLTSATFIPRGGTPLLDAMGRAIGDLQGALAAMDTTDRPEKVVMVFVTDGQENASREFTRAAITTMIEERQSSGWEIVFMSADLSAINEAGDLHVRGGATLAFDASSLGVRDAFCSLHSAVRESRAGASRLEFSPGDRARQHLEAQRMGLHAADIDQVNAERSRTAAELDALRHHIAAAERREQALRDEIGTIDAQVADMTRSPEELGRERSAKVAECDDVHQQMERLHQLRVEAEQRMDQLNQMARRLNRA